MDQTQTKPHSEVLYVRFPGDVASIVRELAERLRVTKKEAINIIIREWKWRQ